MSMFVGVLFFKVFCIILFSHYTHWVSWKQIRKKDKIMSILIPKGYLLGIMKKKKRKEKRKQIMSIWMLSNTLEVQHVSSRSKCPSEIQGWYPTCNFHNKKELVFCT
jgi:dipeptide/tripeptide permease